MADSQVPGTPGDTGVQRALGERRRRRSAERTGQVDLDATMSQWPVTEPPTTPRPVVRPARPSLDGVATGPVLPTPGAMVVGPLLEARSAAAPRASRDGSRRARRGGVRPAGAAAATTIAPGSGSGAGSGSAATSSAGTSGAGAGGAGTGGAGTGGAGTGGAGTGGAGTGGAGTGGAGTGGTGTGGGGPSSAGTGPGAVAGAAAGAGTRGGTRGPAGRGRPAADGPAGGTDADRTLTGPQPTVPRDPAPAGAAAAAAAAAAATATSRRSGGAATPAPRPAPATPRQPRALLAEAQGGGTGGLLQRLGGRRVALLGLAALLVAVLVVVLLVVLRPGEDPAQAVEPVPEVPAQQTFALALAEATGGALVGAALVGVDSAEVSTLLLPQDLILTVADGGPLSLTEATALGGEAVRRGLEDTLLLRVDGVTVVAPEQLATLVDAAGGVVVDVTTAVVDGDVLVAVGDDQRLAGAQAVAYASLAVEGEPAEARLARFGAVVQALLAALPADPAGAGAALTSAGITATEGLPADRLAEVVAAAAGRASAGNAEQVVLPTEELVVAATARRGVDDEAARPELASRFAGAMLPVAAVGEVRVLVRNAVGRPGLGAAARDLLVAEGLRFAGAANAASFGEQPQTAVLVPSQDQDDRDRGEAVVAALGLDDGALQVNSETLVDTDVVVVLGDDFARAVAEQTTDAGTAPGTTSGEAP